MARADFNVRAYKVAWRHTAPAALFFWPGSTVRVSPKGAELTEPSFSHLRHRSLLLTTRVFSRAS